MSNCRPYNDHPIALHELNVNCNLKTDFGGLMKFQVKIEFFTWGFFADGVLPGNFCFYAPIDIFVYSDVQSQVNEN